MTIFSDKKFVWFVVKFVLLFCLFYYGTRAIIGLAAPGDLYSPFIAKYFDYVSWIKYSLMWGTKIIMDLVGYATQYEPGYIVRVINGAAIKIEMSCVGYGVYSFWAAYVLAGDSSMKKKLLWTMGGLISLWLINVLRIALFLWTIQLNKDMPLGIDHHTWFNIIAYMFIFGMIWVFERGSKGSRGSKVES